MQLAPNPAEMSLRDEVRAFLSEHQPDDGDVPADFDDRVTFLGSGSGPCTRLA